jgi:hypothetical protein
VVVSAEISPLRNLVRPSLNRGDSGGSPSHAWIPKKHRRPHSKHRDSGVLLFRSAWAGERGATAVLLDGGEGAAAVACADLCTTPQSITDSSPVAVWIGPSPLGRSLSHATRKAELVNFRWNANSPNPTPCVHPYPREFIFRAKEFVLRAWSEKFENCHNN